MIKKVVLAGLLGGLVLFVWIFVINGVFGFNNQMNMKSIPDERILYDVLKNSISKPGRYIANPELTAEGVFPDGEPVFSIQYHPANIPLLGKSCRNKQRHKYQKQKDSESYVSYHKI